MLNEYNIDYLGCTTAGEFTDRTIADESIAMLLLDMDPEHYCIVHAESGSQTTREIAKSIGQIGAECFKNPAYIVFSGGIRTDGDQIVLGIEDAIGSDQTVFGALAGDNFSLTGTYIFDAEGESDNGLSAIVLNQDRISVQGIATSGWKPVGTIRTVTKSEGNVVYTIDDEPALDMVMKFMGVPEDIDHRTDIMIDIGAEYPLHIKREEGPSVLRAPLFANKENRSFVCAGSVPQGSKVRFSLPPDFDIIDTVVEECKKVRDLDLPEADATLLFSCAARKLSLGPLVESEIQGVQNVWGVPMAGSFCYGEIGAVRGGKHEFHNNTCSIVALRERP